MAISARELLQFLLLTLPSNLDIHIDDRDLPYVIEIENSSWIYIQSDLVDLVISEPLPHQTIRLLQTLSIKHSVQVSKSGNQLVK